MLMSKDGFSFGFIVSLHVFSFLTLFARCNFATYFNLDALSEHKIVKRERAFQLAYIEADFENQEKEKARISDRALSKQTDQDEMDEICKEKCNSDLKRGLDMVKAHLAFGSIGVPPVVDELDLLLYCRIDTQHDRCLRKCGFAVQFNMRDFICKKNYQKMKSFLPCYEYASSRLKRECGALRCGPYASLNSNSSEYTERCRMLSCDLTCTKRVLIQRCGYNYGLMASAFLGDYVKEQVTYWISNASRKAQFSEPKTPSLSCGRLVCESNDYETCIKKFV